MIRLWTLLDVYFLRPLQMHVITVLFKCGQINFEKLGFD